MYHEDLGGNPEVMALIGKSHLAWKRYIQKSLVSEAITLKQFYLLLQLAGNPFLFPAQVAAMLFCDRPTASVILKNMEKQGWIQRQKDPHNRKQVRVIITSSGTEKLTAIRNHKTLKQRFAGDPLTCFSAAEAAEFIRLLRKFHQYIQELTGETGGVGDASDSGF